MSNQDYKDLLIEVERLKTEVRKNRKWILCNKKSLVALLNSTAFKAVALQQENRKENAQAAEAVEEILGGLWSE